MSATYQHPSLSMHVTPEQRDRAEAWLKDAYADGRISEVEFDQRIGQVLTAVTRKDMNEAFYGLVQVPTQSRALGLHPAYRPLIQPETKERTDRGVAAFAHFSVFFLWLLGPGLVYALSTPGTYARREAAKAFNFQMISAVAFIVIALLGGITGLELFGWLMPFMALGWLILTIVGGAKALQGEDWKNPVKRVARFELLSEK